MKEAELIKTTLGAFTRLSAEPSEALVDYFYHDRSARTPEQFDAYIDMTLAHTVMLLDQKIIERPDAKALLTALLQVKSLGVEHFPLNPKLTETVLQVEHYVIAQTSPEIGGNLHIGRSRCDLSPSISRLALRAMLLRILDRTIELRRTALKIAEHHTETVMPAYTHFQHAQPTTFGHYLVSFADGLARDTERLVAALRTTNRSPLGTAATQTTSWPIDRSRLAALLGYDGLVDNSRDAGCAKDYLVETLSAFALLMSNVCRFATDLWIWETFEFGMIELSDEYTGTSSAMPQKKNPYPLEVMRYRYDQIVGDLMTAFMALKGPASIDSESLLLDTSTEPAMHAAKYTDQTLDFITGVLSTIKVNEKRMRTLAGANFAQVLELADTIAQNTDIAWRTAHHIVGRVVREAVAGEIHPERIPLELLDKASLEIAGRPTGLTEEQVGKALDPAECVRTHAVIGGPAPEEVRRQLHERWLVLNEDATSLAASRAGVEAASAELDREVQRTVSNAVAVE